MIKIESANLGWSCPKCSRVYSPITMECSSCNLALKIGSTTTVSLSGLSAQNAYGWCNKHGQVAVPCGLCAWAPINVDIQL